MSNHKENTMRYKVTGDWQQGRTASIAGQVYSIERADIIDTKNGHRYSDGAYRVTLNGKPMRGKGGTTPFFGETAWNDVERRFDDLVSAARRAA